MPVLSEIRRPTLAVLLAAGVLAWGGSALAQQMSLSLSGDAEVPPVSTSASGEGQITVGSDQSVSGEVTTRGVKGTMAHIHQGAAGKNGPVIIPLKDGGDGKWMVPPGTKLTDAQYKAFKAGDLYVNVHSAEHKGGEIRAQLKP